MTTYLNELISRTKKFGQLATTHQGGLAYEITPWDRLHRFLILGSDGGNFYVSERELTRENAQVVIDLLDEDGVRVVEQIVAISTSGDAVRQQPAIFALSLAAAHDVADVRKAALAAVPQVCRTGSHLFTFAAYSDAMRGWGRGLKRSVADWYQTKSAEDLIYQAIKYQQRDGWTHADLLRLTHPKASSPEINAIYKWIVDGEYPSESDDQLAAAIRLRSLSDRDEAGKLIRDYRLPREIVPTELLKEPDIWAALLEDMPMTAMIRNLGTMSKVELLTVGSEAEKRVLSVLSDADRIRRARVHPMAILLAQVTYAHGEGYRSKATWKPSRHVVDALDAAFYTAFGNVTPSNKRMLVAIDSSGSMSSSYGSNIAGSPLTALQAAGAMALVTLATEPNADVIAFDTKVYTPSLSSRQRLDDVVRMLSIHGGGTDMSLPWQHAGQSRQPYEGIVVYTDAEDGYGFQPQVRREYASRNPGSREVVVAMTANQYSAVDGPWAMNVVGFDASAPPVISKFIAGAV